MDKVEAARRQTVVIETAAQVASAKAAPGITRDEVCSNLIKYNAKEYGEDAELDGFEDAVLAEVGRVRRGRKAA